MAWENFWKLDEKGRRLTSGEQLAAFRRNFPERVVDPKPAIGRPLIIVLDKPYKLTRFPGAEIFEHDPIRLRDINGWPPSLSLSRFGHFPKPGDGEVVDAKVIPPDKPGADPVLVIRAEFQDQQAACAIVGYPSVFLECVARTLNDHVGETFRSLNDLELAGDD
jgi:hypothetical protein